MNTRQQRYHSYLLRMWQVADGDMLLWRASLEAAGTGERRGFGNLEELCRWLQDQADAGTPLPGLGEEGWGEPGEGPSPDPPRRVHKEENHA
jgi:hypothetical protein